MRKRIILAGLVVMLLVAACSSEKQQSSSLVTSAGFAPYYTNLAEALKAAKTDQYVVMNFYTDW